MLIIFAGLPGTGKTTLARELARRLTATYLRIDTIEQAIYRSGIAIDDMGPTGYFVGYAAAEDNLRFGLTVIADSVNPLTVTRDAWVEVATRAAVPFLEIEVVCSDPVEHRRRVESRQADIPGLKLPSWQDVLNRRQDPWTRPRTIADTGLLPVSHWVEVIASLASNLL